MSTNSARPSDKIRGMDARARLAEAAKYWDKAKNAYTGEPAKYVAAPKVLDAGALSCPA